MSENPDILDGMFLYANDDVKYAQNSDKITEWLMMEFYKLDGDKVFEDSSFTAEQKNVLKKSIKERLING